MQMPPAPVRVAEALSTDVPLNVTAIGNVEAASTVDVKSRVAGQVLRMNFQEGQDVQKGQLLFEIDPEPLLRQIAESEANLARDTALEAQARASIVRDQATVKQNKAQAERGLALAKDGIFSKEQTEQVVATSDASQASLEADRAALESATASIAADRARLQQTRLQLSYTKILAPITGRAGAVAVKAGNLIKDNDAVLVTLLEVKPIFVTFGVPEQLLPDVRRYNAERPLLITALGADQKAVTGTLKFIDSSVDMTTGTIRLKAQFANQDRVLWPGQFVNVTARLELEHGRVLVPNRTVQSGPEGKYVWVVDRSSSQVSMRPVTVLRTYMTNGSDEQAVIGTGLRAGETVISEGQMRLAPGAKVRMLEADKSDPGASRKTS